MFRHLPPRYLRNFSNYPRILSPLRVRVDKAQCKNTTERIRTVPAVWKVGMKPSRGALGRSSGRLCRRNGTLLKERNGYRMATSCIQGRRPALTGCRCRRWRNNPNPAVSSADQCDGGASRASKSSYGVWPHTTAPPTIIFTCTLSLFFPSTDSIDTKMCVGSVCVCIRRECTLLRLYVYVKLRDTLPQVDQADRYVHITRSCSVFPGRNG